MLGDEVIKQLLPKDTNFTGEQIENCLRQNSEDTVILLDGFDESQLAFQGTEGRLPNGSLYRSIKYEEFRYCRIVVTSRPSKADEFRGQLFNSYAEISINGFVRISIDEFIDNYCNEKVSAKVKQFITSNLLSLQPLLRVPLFLAMICETVSNDLITNRPFTRTNLIITLCKYLFNTYCDRYKSSENKVARNLLSINLNDCLATLGRLAGKQYIIDMKGNDLTPQNHEILEICMKVGFISTNERRRMQGKENCLYFFHGLLRDLCVAQHIVSSRASTEIDAQSQNLIDIHDVQISDSVFIFECGLLAGRECVQTVFDFSSWSGYGIENCTTDFLIQCYFECQSEGYMEIRTDIFNKNRTLFMDLNVLNDFAAVKHFLSHNPQSLTDYYFTQFVIKGEEYNIVEEKMNTQDKERDCLFNNLDLKIIYELMSPCLYLTSITLLNCAFTLVGYEGKQTSQFKSIQFMSVCGCRGKQLLNTLLYSIAKQYPYLQSLILTKVFDVNADECDQILNLCNMVSMLFDVGPTCSEVKLAGMDGEDLDNLQCDVHESLQELKVFDSVEVLNTSKLLTSLALHFPSLSCLTLSRCQLHFDNSTSEQKPAQNIATSNMQMIIKECKTSIVLSNLLAVGSICFPYLNLLRIADSSIDFQNMTEKFHLKNLKYVYFKHCLQAVDLSHVIPTFKSMLSRLPHLAFIDCSLNSSLELMNNCREELFPDIALTNCRIPYQCISWMSTWCERLTMHVNENLYVEILYEQVWSERKLIAHLHSKFRININDAANLPGWFPDLHALYFYSSLQPLTLEEFLGVQYPSVQVCLFRECKEEVNMSDTVSILNTCCPILEKMFIRYCDVSFGSDTQFVQSDIRQVEFDGCRFITYSAVMSFIALCCPYAVELTIGNSEIGKDESLYLSRMTAPEHNISMSSHPVGSTILSAAGLPRTRHKALKLKFLERVYLTNCSTSLDITDIIIVTNYYVQTLVASIILTKCPVNFTSEIAIPNSPILKVVTLDGCKLPSKGIFWVAKLCHMVHLYMNDNLLIEVFQNTYSGKDHKVIHIHSACSEAAIDMGSVPVLPTLLPNIDVIVFFNVLVDDFSDTWKGVRYSSVKSVHFMDCEDVVSIQQAFTALSRYCQNVDRFVVVNGYVLFDKKEDRFLPLKELIFDRVRRLRFLEIVDFITTQCPILEDLKIQESELEDESNDAEGSTPAASSNLKAIGFYDFVKVPVDVSKVISIVKLRLQAVISLSFTTCKLAWGCDINPSSYQWFESILFKDCIFPTKALVNIKSSCERVYIQVDDVFIEVQDAKEIFGKLKAILKSDNPINIHDAIQLPFDKNDDEIYEFDFHNVLDCRQHNPERGRLYVAVSFVHFLKCKHSLNIPRTLSVFSSSCPNLRELTISDTNVILGGERVESLGQVKRISMENVNHFDFKDILLLLTFQCPSVEYISVINAEISFHSFSLEMPNIDNCSIKEIYLCNCNVPEKFMQLLNEGYPEFEISYFLNENKRNCETAEWLITRKPD
ncbi:uncharacterized protein LOC135157216 [Lytechinus pictus]|uniref:uncharacterized protein LOC135157216 n=1 Tax=Lytechinus pictus TaxID=7653 RepID=UPI0030B9E6E9